jgi:general stress protein CsbA
LGFFLLSVVGLLAFCGYITFLWFAANDNTTWKNIALAGWMTQSIAVAAVVLRTAITIQAGLASSMIAGILLEGSGVILPKLAAISLMRATFPAPFTLFIHLWSNVGFQNWVPTGLAVVLSVTTISLQFTSTVLLADVDTGLVTG